MTYCVALIGNIGSGKSTAAHYFNQLGIQSFNADQMAKSLTAIDTEIYAQIVQHFGTNICLPNKELNRKLLRQLIFANPSERRWLENVLHPKIREALYQESMTCSSPYCLIEIPLLKNKAHYPYISRVLLVTSPVELQIDRIVQRDQCTPDEALSIINAQPKIEERMALADDVLINDSEWTKLQEKVQALHNRYLLHP